ncbi:glycosyltransferase family 4 protein [Thermicanus aegyptius]|uniref:glycosyltransferase family 4 protein n=1 Tax=Thermicanus aegyptius TaxID=94009 RepID=UPI00040F68B8|nr:glycosyltransferase family 4 protein [Thermicanus aegyptius]
MSKEGKVLLISYLFPPIAGGGVPRPLKMVKYLPQYGWNPVVLTVDPRYHASLDESLLQQIPDLTPIYRAREFNPYASINRLRTSSLQESSRRRKNGSGDTETSIHKTPSEGGSFPQKEGSSWIEGVKQGLFKALKKGKNWILIPDDHIFWVPFAVRMGLRAIREQKVDLIYSTSGPYSCHLVARRLAHITRLPWVADFRDPWTQNMHRSGIAWREWIEERMERSVMREATAITTVTHSFAQNFKAKFPEIRQIEVIHNGYDPDDYLAIEGEPDPDRLSFAYTGIFYKERNPRLFLRAVAELIDEGRIKRDELRLRFAGIFDYPGYHENEEAVKNLGLEDIVEVLGYLPHRESLTLLKKSHILLLIGDTAPGSENYIPGKLFEYLAVKRPVLAFSLPGEATQIIERFHIGQAVSPTDLEAMKKAILTFYEAWKRGELADLFSFTEEESALALYRRDEQARQLAHLFNEIKEEMNEG